MNSNSTNVEWKRVLREIIHKPHYISSPRGMMVKELIGSSYKVEMPAFIDLVDRKVNYSFMFAEAAWILSGSNRLEDITPYMKAYKNYSDDGVFLRGAYGPKITDQLGYIADCLEQDRESRQAVINIWRERPGTSKDIPCTISMQFLIRGKILHSVVTMRSNDIIKGFTYDVFTFSMVATAVKLLLKSRGIDVDLGFLTVNAGSLHLYETDYKKADIYQSSVNRLPVTAIVETILKYSDTYEELIERLWSAAKKQKELQNEN